MEVRGNNGFIESFLAQKLLTQQRAPSTSQSTTTSPTPTPKAPEPSQARDLVTFSNTNFGQNNRNARLVRETQEETDNGIRLVQEFVTQEGREFTRIQDFAITNRGFERNVIQQNPSGSTIQLEEILNRQDNGLFQRIQRFTNEIGETQARVENDFVSRDPFVLSGGERLDTSRPANQNNLFETVRGTRLDVEA